MVNRLIFVWRLQISVKSFGLCQKVQTFLDSPLSEVDFVNVRFDRLFTVLQQGGDLGASNYHPCQNIYSYNQYFLERACHFLINQYKVLPRKWFHPSKIIMSHWKYPTQYDGWGWPGIHGPPGPGTDRSESVRDLEFFLGPGPNWS